MDWIVEGVALVSLACLVAAVTAVDAAAAVSSAAYAVAIATLLVLANKRVEQIGPNARVDYRARWAGSSPSRCGGTSPQADLWRPGSRFI